MQVQLPSDLDAFVQELIDTGRYPSPEEVVHHALWLLKDQSDFRAMKLAELRKQIAIGIEQADRGESVPLDMNAILAEARRRLQQEREKCKEAAVCPRVIHSPQATEDLIDILLHIEGYNPAAANRFSAEVDKKCERLAQFPGLGAACEELAPGSPSSCRQLCIVLSPFQHACFPGSPCDYSHNAV